MEDPGWSWPAWKFGMKRDDLFTKLHDQYNTVPSSIQDPEAFHHDVFEISHDAATADEFHRLLAERRNQRLRELNDSLELASVEIIANPALIGSDQWQYAVQLFRTRSLDSLVRYFASYLPEGHNWHTKPDDGMIDNPAQDMQQSSLFFGGHDDDEDAHHERPAITHEPLSIHTSAELPPSPRSIARSADSSIPSPFDDFDEKHHQYLDNLTPPHTLSFSETGSDRFDLRDSCSRLHDDYDNTSVSDPETPTTSISDLSEIDEADETDDVSSGVVVQRYDVDVQVVEADDMSFDKCPPACLSADPTAMTDSETPTPKPEAAATAFFVARPSPISMPTAALPHRRNVSPWSTCLQDVDDRRGCRRSPRSHRQRHYFQSRDRSRDSSPEQGRRRSGMVGSARVGRVQKPALPVTDRSSRSRGRKSRCPC